MPKYYHRNPNGTFTVVKRLDNKNYSFGTFHTEKEAKDRVEFLKKMDWDLKYRVKRNNCNHIYYNGTCYFIQKNGKYYGSYNTIEEAEKAREVLKKHNWDNKYVKYRRKRKNPISRYITRTKSGNYVITKTIDNKKVDFGTFHNLKDAEEERDELIRCNWDWELICNGGGL